MFSHQLRDRRRWNHSLAESLLMSSNAGRESKRHPVSKRRLPTDEIPNVLEGEIRIATEVSECYRRQGCETLHHQERHFEEAAASQWWADRLLQAETARVATQTISQMNARFFWLENNVSAEFDERQRIYIHEISVESAQAFEAQREVSAHEAAEENWRRDIMSLGLMRALEVESVSEVAVQREGLERTRDYLQRILNASSEGCRKFYHLYKEFQNETAPARCSSLTRSRKTVDLRDLWSSVPRRKPQTISPERNCETEVGNPEL